MMGKLEEAVLLTLVRLGTTNAANVVEALKPHYNAPLGAVYTTLVRMTSKGWVKQSAAAQRGGPRPRTYFEILPEGRARLKESVQLTMSLASQLSESDFG